MLGMTFTIASIQLSAIRAKGRSGLCFWMDVVKNSVSLGMLVFTIQHGVLAIVIGQVLVSMFAVFVVNGPASWVVYGYEAKHQFADVFAYLICCFLGVLAAVCFAQLIASATLIVLLIGKLVVFSFVYLLSCYVQDLAGMKVIWNKIEMQIPLWSRS